jgi:hypothetical protein
LSQPDVRRDGPGWSVATLTGVTVLSAVLSPAPVIDTTQTVFPFGAMVRYKGCALQARDARTRLDAVSMAVTLLGPTCPSSPSIPLVVT